MITDSTTRRVLLLPGDGIGPEVLAQGQRVLEAACKQAGIPLVLQHADMGGCAVDRHGSPLPESTLEAAKTVHGILMGAVGGPQYDALPPEKRPEKGLLAIRQGLQLFANLRPVSLFPSLLHAVPLKPELLAHVDMLIVRELTGGAYFGLPRERTAEGARDSIVYTREEITRIARVGFQLAQQRQKRLCSVDKANVLATSQLWREVVNELAPEYADVALTHMYVDNAAMQLIARPAQFDVLLTENMFGDILSDEASMLSASLGMLPSASLGITTHAFGQLGLYEPCHGSAPDIAGQNKANPVGTILSVAMLCRSSLDLPDMAVQIEQAVSTVLAAGLRTADIATDRLTAVTTSDFGDAVLKALQASTAGS